ncbi:class I SAM-dependent methyltransferase [Komarekiella sp. 'clone 1']|uniref:Class I SAM-dependent methyltransferase n=1 Tax=Komarekiella delphini-convector SJRDD-AB1 TaxID=2593771 RepID=A0AA40T305_9NOST|nr:class I SAM-dependent methyltransferase [Komarekiella delphini-convector]MBD6619988.1 class I SAM-dependent methyltransferase [Komarekiella delphini-convector SJRDD-AB1]
MKKNIDSPNLSDDIQKEIENILLDVERQPMEVEEIWQLMDDVWDSLGCNNINEPEKVSLFYSHPVWLLNGLFIEQHDVSILHRHAIANWINVNSNDIISVLDYGGGFGTLARLIADKNQEVVVDIYEPHPSQLALEKIKAYSSVNFISSLKKQYDCLVCTDVLEHVPDPLSLLAEMIESVKIDGYLVIANCFYPVIKCHLPETFHLRYSFNQFTNLMGLDTIGSCNGSHATIYKKIRQEPVNWKKIRTQEKISKALFPFLSRSQSSYQGLKKLFLQNKN